MTGTSVQLLITNHTSVERLGAKTKIITLAVKRPPPEELAKINPYVTQNPSYNVITYPLEPGHAPTSQLRQEPPIVSSAESDVHTNPINQNQNQNQNQKSSAGPKEPATSNGLTREGALPPSMVGAAASENNHPGRVSENGVLRERLSTRDLNATKTFAILSTSEPGDNPWNLGSRLSNWKTVMGTNVFDWFLPVRQSPCSNHEDPESHFSLGPTVDRLREEHSLIAGKAIPLRRGHKGFFHRLHHKDPEMANGEAGENRAQGQKRKEIESPTSTLGSDDQIKMNDLNGHASKPPLA
jgi:palmitoyltransferase